MKVRPVRSAKDHAAALRQIERLMDAQAHTPEGERLDTLVAMVEAYKSRRWPLDGRAEGDGAPSTATALAAIMKIAEHWSLNCEECAALLGVTLGAWDRMAQGRWEGTLSQDQLTRISVMVGIFEELRQLFANDMAYRWVRRRNKGPLFEDRTPIETMIEGGIPAMLEIRRYLHLTRRRQPPVAYGDLIGLNLSEDLSLSANTLAGFRRRKRH